MLFSTKKYCMCLYIMYIWIMYVDGYMLVRTCALVFTYISSPDLIQSFYILFTSFIRGLIHCCWWDFPACVCFSVLHTMCCTNVRIWIGKHWGQILRSDKKGCQMSAKPLCSGNSLVCCQMNKIFIFIVLLV